MGRKREDSATVGDLEDLGKAIRDGLKDALGNVIPSPTPKEGDPPAGDPPAGDPPAGDHDDSWGFAKGWFGSKA